MNSYVKVGFTLLLAAVPSLQAHDFWIEPSKHSLARNEQVGFTLRVGEHYAGDTVPRMASHLKSFRAFQGSIATPIGGRANASPAGSASFDRQGAVTVAYESNPRVVEMKRTTFARYIVEEGLEAGAARLDLDGKAKIRDAFSRHAKTVVAVDGAPIRDQRVGMEFELVAVGDLRAASQARKVSLRVLFRSQPAPGVLVIALNKVAGDRPLRARSDAKGEVVLPIDSGKWLIKAVHLIPATDTSTSDIESFWASLTVEL